MVTATKPEPGRGQEPGTSIPFPTRMTEAQTLRTFSAASQGHQLASGAELKQKTKIECDPYGMLPCHNITPNQGNFEQIILHGLHIIL